MKGNTNISEIVGVESSCYQPSLTNPSNTTPLSSSLAIRCSSSHKILLRVPRLQVCPLLPGEKYRRYHSLVNNEANPSIFVVQHTSQAYPAYLITFH